MTIWLGVIVAILAVAAAWLAWELVNLKQTVAGLPLGDDELYDLLHRLDNELGLHSAAIADLQDRVLRLEQLAVTSLRRSGVVSYDAYGDVGGGRSRSIALLDEEGSGLVVSVLVSRSDTSFYLKRIDWRAPAPKEKPRGG